MGIHNINNWFQIIILGSSAISLLYVVTIFTWIVLSPSKNNKLNRSFTLLYRFVLTYLGKQIVLVGGLVAVLASFIYQFLGLPSAIGFFSGGVLPLFLFFFIYILSLFTVKKSINASTSGIAGVYTIASRSSLAALLIGLSIVILVADGIFHINSSSLPLLSMAFGFCLAASILKLSGDTLDKIINFDSFFSDSSQQIIVDEESSLININEQISQSIYTQLDILESFIIGLIIVPLFAESFLYNFQTFTNLSLLLASGGMILLLLSSFIPFLSHKSINIALIVKTVFGISFFLIASYILDRFLAHNQLSWEIQTFNTVLLSMAILTLLAAGSEYYFSLFRKKISSFKKEKVSIYSFVDRFIMSLKFVFFLILLALTEVFISQAINGVYFGLVVVLITGLLAFVFFNLSFFSSLMTAGLFVSEYINIPKKGYETFSKLNEKKDSLNFMAKNLSYLLNLFVGLSFFLYYTRLPLREYSLLLSDARVFMGLILGLILPYFLLSLNIETIQNIKSKYDFDIASSIREVRKKAIKNISFISIISRYLMLINIKTLLIISLMSLSVIVINFGFGYSAISGFLIGLIISYLTLSIPNFTSSSIVNKFSVNRNSVVEKDIQSSRGVIVWEFHFMNSTLLKLTSTLAILLAIYYK